MKFAPTHKVLTQIEEPSVGEIINEPMLFGADRSFAQENGGPIMSRLLRRLPVDWQDVVVDSRSHMLKPGWFPCIGGWHLDDIPRLNGHPRIFATETNTAEHLLVVFDKGTGSLTQFLDDPYHLCSLETRVAVTAGANVYGHANADIADHVAHGALSATSVSSGSLVQFGSTDWHRGMAATGDGWRHFIRITRNTQRPTQNQIRKQVQVYQSQDMAGW